MDIKKKSTTINEVCRKNLGVSRDEYALCSYVQYRSADPRNVRPGWCCDEKDEIADFVGITRPGLYKMVSRMVNSALLYSEKSTYRVTEKWVDAENSCKLSLHDDVNLVYTDVNLVYTDVNLVYTECKLSLHENQDFETDAALLVINNKKESTRETHVGPAPDHTLSTVQNFSVNLEAEKEKNPPPVAPPPPAVGQHAGPTVEPANGGRKSKSERRPVVIPEDLNTPEFTAAWSQLLTAKKWRCKDSSQLETSLKKLSKYPAEFAVQLCERAYEANWVGVVFDGTPEAFAQWKAAKTAPATPAPQRPAYGNNFPQPQSPAMGRVILG